MGRGDRRRGGRPRKVEAPREPSGAVRTPTQRERAEDATQTVVEARMRHHGIDRATARSQHGGSAPGRMLAAGLVDEPEYEALTRYAIIRRRFVVALHGPMEEPASLDVERVSGIDHSDTEAQDRWVAETWRDAARALAQAHPLAHKAIADVATRDVDVPYITPPLRCGLDALVALWGLMPEPSGANKKTQGAEL